MNKQVELNQIMNTIIHLKKLRPTKSFPKEAINERITKLKEQYDQIFEDN